MKRYSGLYLYELINKNSRFSKMKSHEELDKLYCEYNDYLESFNKRLLSPIQFIKELMIGCNTSKKEMLINFLKLYYEEEEKYKSLIIDDITFFTLTPYKKYITLFQARKGEKYNCIIEKYIFDNGYSKGIRCYLTYHLIEEKKMTLLAKDQMKSDIQSCNMHLRKISGAYNSKILWYEVPVKDMNGDDK
ncbi:hypothetical protein [Paenibacillus tianjinensis]|uniref:Uncharacterized protein n=1 Tax=Paenibacillus tianjinensis TaxID=2810347 RepID=A0ABX7L7F4_9BACL|nr:hypothetical protein [Paenibacillus tianjinensis]QSF43256.1 hypothetical protein JRJ22_18490 [Paenibacillus tianjinensis]